ncbi:Uncharacterized protein TPAR_06517 [Tolypocladium paradoxum]|uniref:Uncharacterized protein n=1 Tax=Tolypocladium paradoxum TaxID=94208 RepID=A0A2S4KSZ1_9HYPO|nr:Uncharacterized protein TPAR_06517 [Tolypocladium paradoxum]
MGNTSSSEASRKAPQRLSKPRPGNRLLAADLLSPSDLSASSSTRYCDSYLAGSRPALEQFPSPTQDAPVEREDAAANSSAAERRLSMRESGVHSAIFAVPSPSHEPQTRGRRRSTEVASSAAEDRLSRPNSLVRHGGGGVQPPNRTHRNGYREQQGWTQSDNRPSASRRPSYVDPNCLQRTQSTSTESKSETSQPADAPCRSPRPPETVSSPIARNNSDASLYIPMRRRSVIQTPGVATRVERNDPRSPTHPSIQVNHATPATQPSYDSPAPPQNDSHLPLPSYAPISEPQERAVTPCEADYRQLGGMKFGTLRITNGSPVRSPAVEIGNQVARHSERQSDSSETGRFAHDEPAWPLKEGVILSDKLYPDDRVNVAQPLSHDSTPVLSSSASESTSGQNIELEMEISWLLGLNGEDTVTATPSPQSTDSRSTSDRQSSPDSSENMLEQDRIDVQNPSPEVLDVREDPSAKFRDTSNGPRSSSKPLGSSMTRSDCGFVSTSTSSSTSSRGTVSQEDSGYSSNFSLRSIRISSKKKGRDAEQAARSTERAPESRDSLPPPLGYSTHSGRGNRSASSSFAFMSRDRMRRLSARAGKDREHPFPDAGVSSRHFRSKSADVEVAHFQETAESRSNSTINRKGKLHRLLAGSTKRQSLPMAYKSHDIHDAVPAVPSDIEEKLREHSELFPTASKRIALRAESSQETLKTITSVESVDLADARTRDVDSFREAQREQTFPRKGWQHARQPLPVVPRTQAQESAPSWNLAPRVSIKRKPVGSESRMRDHSEEDLDCISGDARTDAVGDAGSYNGADARGLHISTCVVDDEPRSSSRVRRTLTRPSRKPSAYSSKTHALKAPASAPDLKDSLTIPPYPTLSQPNPYSNKSPPPISMRTRGVKTPRQQASSMSSSTALEVVPSLSQKSSRESLHSLQWHPSQITIQDPSLAGKQPQLRYSYEIPIRQPPVVYRQPYFRDRSTGSPRHSDDQGQYRILHSYNSPAYKNVPIWG